jgi:hypothetical protein
MQYVITDCYAKARTILSVETLAEMISIINAHSLKHETVLEYLSKTMTRLYFDIENVPQTEQNLIYEIKDALALVFNIANNNFTLTLNMNSGQHAGLSYHLYFPYVIDRTSIVLTLQSSKFVDTLFKYIDMGVYNNGRIFRCINQLKPYANDNDIFTSELDYHKLIVGSIEDTIIQNIDSLPSLSVIEAKDLIPLDSLLQPKKTSPVINHVSYAPQSQKFLVIKSMLVTLNQTMNLGIERIPDTLFITEYQNTRLIQSLRELIKCPNNKEKIITDLKLVLDEIHDGTYYYGAIGQFVRIKLLQPDEYTGILAAHAEVRYVSKYPLHGNQGKIIKYLVPSLNNLLKTCKLAVHKYATDMQSLTIEDRKNILERDVKCGHALLTIALSHAHFSVAHDKVYLDTLDESNDIDPNMIRLANPELAAPYAEYTTLNIRLAELKRVLYGTKPSEPNKHVVLNDEFIDTNSSIEPVEFARNVFKISFSKLDYKVAKDLPPLEYCIAMMRLLSRVV